MLEFIAVKFIGEKTAKKAADLVAQRTNIPWYNDVALVSRNENGKLKVHSNYAQDDDYETGSTGVGLLSGGLIGALFGPVGAVVGAIGGAAIGKKSGKLINEDINDPTLAEFANSLENNSSAIVIVSKEEYADDIKAAFGDYDNTRIYETYLNETDLKIIKNELKKQTQKKF